MDKDELLSADLLRQWNESYSCLLAAIPRGKRLALFGDANLVESVAKTWRKCAIDPREADHAPQAETQP